MKRHVLPVFADYVKQLPPATVFQRLFNGKAPGRRIVSSTALGAKVAAFLQPQNLSRVFDGLSGEARDCAAWVYLFSPAGVPAETMAASVESELLHSLLVCAVRTRDHGIVYRGFRECAGALAAPVARHLADRIGVAPANQGRHSWPWRSLNDLVLVAVRAARGDVKRTKANGLPKSSVLLLRGVLQCARPPWRQEFEPSVFMFLDYAAARGLIRQCEKGFEEAPARFARWLAQPPAAAWKDLIDFCLERYMPIDWAFARRAIFDDGKAWVGTAGLPAGCRERFLSAVRVAHALGLLDASRTNDHIVCGLSAAACDNGAAGQACAAALTVLPDYSAVIPAEVSAADLYWFSKLGTVDTFDQVYRGVVRREQLCDSLAAGLDAETLIGKLTEWRAPANVVESAREWAREFGRASLMTGSLVVSADPSVTEVLSTYGPLREAIARLPAHAVFRIRPGKERLVGEILAGLGFDHRAPRLPEPCPERDNNDDVLEQSEEAEVVLDFTAPAPAQAAEVKGSRYNSQLRARDTGGLIQLIDYALLMGSRLRFEYDGSPAVRKGLYTVTPVSYSTGDEMALEGRDCITGATRKFLVASIKRIGVIEP